MEQKQEKRPASLEWYKGISLDYKVPPRCPFASVHRCPRFYQSLSLLGEAGSTKIDAEEDERLKGYWEGTDLWPVVDDQATSVISSNEKAKHFWNFCPEVSFERFGYFASHLNRYSDELDIDLAHEQLGREKASADDWRWAWAGLTPQHYTDCPLYSLIESGIPHPAESPVDSDISKADSWIRKLKDNKVIATLIVAGLIVISVGMFTDALSNIANFFGFGTPSPQIAPTVTSPKLPTLTPQQEKLLMLVHNYQVQFGARKLIIKTDGLLHFDEPNRKDIKINIADELLGGENSFERAKEFEAIVDGMPPEYLRRIPEMRLGSPFVVTVTEFGIRYLTKR